MFPASADNVERWFRFLDTDRDGVIGGAQAAEFFRRSNLSDDTLREIWKQSTANSPAMGQGQFRVAMKLVALAQHNGGSFTPDLARDIVIGTNNTVLPPPKVRGFSLEEWHPANPFAAFEGNSGTQVSMQSTSTRASSPLSSPRDVASSTGIDSLIPPINSPPAVRPPINLPPPSPINLPLPSPRPSHPNGANLGPPRMEDQLGRPPIHGGHEKSRRISLRKTLIGLGLKKKEEKQEVIVTSGGMGWGGAGLQNFSVSDIRKATNNFEEHLGGGGYGEVYKGSINHVPIAVKVLGQNVMQGSREYGREIALLGSIRHPHIVTLYGKCDGSSSLVYELLPGGNLEEKMECGTLHWEARLRIAKEVALGLFYLHNCCPPIVHRDMKPANVLLDGNLTAKVGDMGLARAVDSTLRTSTAAGGIKGTFHYIAPEYQNSGISTPLCDVYSFGVILLQLLTNRPANVVREEVREALHSSSGHLIVDRRPGAGDWPASVVQSIMELGSRCCQRQTEYRPQMGDVVNTLKELHDNAVATMAVGGRVESVQLDKLLKCPLTQKPLQDPVIADDGHTYEREAIQRWLDSGYRRSPLTNLPLSSTRLLPNHMAKSILTIRQASGQSQS
ncbi:hypothetical protein BSKO_04328 [Bryopsis sp. KO-2023]|nr:hypothetical protein BSKO_04328 [Bryopsis sp. KO-2023]